MDENNSNQNQPNQTPISSSPELNPAVPPPPTKKPNFVKIGIIILLIIVSLSILYILSNVVIVALGLSPSQKPLSIHNSSSTIFPTSPPAGGQNQPTGNETIKSDSDNGTTVVLSPGGLLKISLNSTYWNFDSVVDKNIIKESGTPIISLAPPSQTIPGSGAGTITAEYQAQSPGHTTITASRTTCGEALRCVGNQGSYSLTIVVK